MKAEAYDDMLNRFATTRAILFGITHGISSVLLNEPFQNELTKEATENAFIKVYVCKDCRNRKDDILKTTQSLSRILNLKREEAK